MKRIKVVHLTSAHHASDVRIFHKECKSLMQAGYEVVLVAPSGGEVPQGIPIRMLPAAKSRSERMLRSIWRVYKTALKEKAQVYHFHDPELILIGLLLRLHRRTVIYDVHEDLPRQIMSKYWIPWWLRGIVSAAAGLTEAFGALVFNAIVTVTPVIAKRFPKAKTVVVQNYPLLEESSDCGIRYGERPNIFTYVGGISRIRGMFEMLEASRLVPASYDYQLTLAGEFTPTQLQAQAEQMPGWNRVNFPGWLSRKNVFELLGKSRAGLVLFHPEKNHTEAQPNKLFEYMSAGIPVIASDFPLWREIVSGSQCGLLVDPMNPQQIADAIVWIMEHPGEAEAMGIRGQEAAKSTYNWGQESKKLIDLYERFVAC